MHRRGSTARGAGMAGHRGSTSACGERICLIHRSAAGSAASVFGLFQKTAATTLWRARLRTLREDRAVAAQLGASGGPVAQTPERGFFNPQPASLVRAPCPFIGVFAGRDVAADYKSALQPFGQQTPEMRPRKFQRPLNPCRHSSKCHYRRVVWAKSGPAPEPGTWRPSRSTINTALK